MDLSEAACLCLDHRFAAPCATVFSAWTDPHQLADWWGRHEFTNPVCELEARAGGRLFILMRSFEGEEFPLHGIVREIEPPRCLVLEFDLAAFPESWHRAMKGGLAESDGTKLCRQSLEVRFCEVEGGTKVDLVIAFPSAALREAFDGCGITDGWRESFDSLAALLTRAPLLSAT